MPKFSVRSSNEVPQPTWASKAVQEARRQYEGYVREIGNNVGELEILPGEQVRSIKVRLRRAARQTGSELDIWDINDRIYFRVRPKRGRPPQVRSDCCDIRTAVGPNSGRRPSKTSSLEFNAGGLHIHGPSRHGFAGETAPQVCKPPALKSMNSWLSLAE
jgi:hypothetical protein